MKSCPVCGKTFPAGNFCEDCGVMLVEAQPAPEVQNSPPVNYTQNYPVNPPAPVQKKSGNSSKIIIAVLAVLLVAAIAVAAFFIVKSMNKNDNAAYNKVDRYYETQEQSQAVSATTLTPETTTLTSSTTTAEPAVNASKDDAYNAFNDFYMSYLNAINHLDPSLMTSCSSQIRNEMAERFEINKKSLFDLRRIDFDEDSLYINSSGGHTEYIFYVKCVTMLYDRSTNEQKDLNYSCWRVTVECENNSYTVTDMERDSDYKMSTNIVSVSDSESLF